MRWWSLCATLSCFRFLSVAAESSTDYNPSKVHVVFMTHLDVGFTDTARNVCDRYFEVYVPRALALADDLRARCNKHDKKKSCPAYRWTQFPWLIQEFLDGLAGCAHRPRTPGEVAALEKGIARDDIVWQANPLNLLTELADPGLWEFGLSMKDKLNARYGKRHGRVAAKLSDVTGLSRSAVPALVASGVRAVHVGYNGVGGLPKVIPTNDTSKSPFERNESFCGFDKGCPAEAVFRFREPTTKSEVFMMIEDNYGTEIDVPSNARVTRMHGRTSSDGIASSSGHNGHVLLFHYSVDNSGVPTVDEVEKFWASVQSRFPHSEVVLSTLDDFVEAALPLKDFASQPEGNLGGARDESEALKIPIVTQELGDSWLYGGAGDPVKLATFREARRLLDGAVRVGKLSRDSWQYQSYMRRLLKGPAEHNWGLSIGSSCVDCRVSSWPGFGSTWVKENFERARYSNELQRYPCNDTNFALGSARWGASVGTCGYGPTEQEWAEQREWMHPLPSWVALRGWTNAFSGSRSEEKHWNAFVHDLEDSLLQFRHPQRPDRGQPIQVPTSTFECGGIRVAFDNVGAVNALSIGRRNASGRTWANSEHTLGRFSYVTYSQADFDEFEKEWNNHFGDFAKPGMDTASPESKVWEPTLRGAWLQSGSDDEVDRKCRFTFELTFAEEATAKYGAPRAVFLQYDVPGHGVSHALDLSVSWFDKPATRLPESMWVSFVPTVHTKRAAAWELDVLGYPVDPLDVIERGTRFMHAVSDKGVTLRDGPDTLSVRMLDSALVAPGDIRHLLRYSSGNEQPDVLNGGMHANIHNNVWGTAFPQWYDDDGLVRFSVELADKDTIVEEGGSAQQVALV